MKLTCKTCGQELEFSEREPTQVEINNVQASQIPTKPILVVKFCKECFKEGYNEGYKEGYNDAIIEE